MRAVLALVVAVVYIVLITLVIADIDPRPVDTDQRTAPSLITRGLPEGQSIPLTPFPFPVILSSGG